jgi:threonine/homoserine/homoserine lactone efflux protein
MPDLDTLVLFAGASIVLLVIPGPSVLYVVTRSVAQGRRAGAVSVLGVGLGNFSHAVAAAIGVSAIIASSAVAFTVVKYAGAAYLIYLGVRALVARSEAPLTLPERTRSDRRLFWEGFLVDFLNPKVALFFLAFFPQFVDPAQGTIAPQMLMLGAVFTSLGLISDGTYALTAGTLGARFRTRRSERRLQRASGAIYLGLGVSAALAEGGTDRS